METPPLDDVLKSCIEKIWDKYDDDGSGYLDREETAVFIAESMHDPTDDKSDSETSSQLTHSQFEACFQSFDIDGNGVIDKEEML